ncbi:hypothetical protein BJX76DRAFT_359604 [Aspergillus varians]
MREPRNYSIYDSLPPTTTDERGDWTNILEDTSCLESAVKRIRGYNSQQSQNVKRIFELVYSVKVSKSIFEKRFPPDKPLSEEVVDGSSHSIPDAMSQDQPNIKRKGGKRKKGSDQSVMRMPPSIRPYPSEQGAHSHAYPTSETLEQYAIQPAFVDRTYMSTIPVVQSPETFHFAEKLLHGIKLFVLQLFRSASWHSNSLILIPPEGTRSLAKRWKDISDQCWSLGPFFRNGTASEEGQMKLDSIFAAIEAVLQHNDPHLLVRIWQVCRYVYGLGAVQRNSVHLRRLLTHLAGVSRNNDGSMSSVVQIFDALNNMPKDDVLWALRIGQMRSIKCLQDTVGRGHPAVLCMWSYHAKQWRLHGTYESELLAYYRNAWKKAQQRYGEISSEALSILHDFLYYTVYCCKEESSLKRDLSYDLFKGATAVLDSLINETNTKHEWGIHTQDRSLCVT